MFKDPVVEDIRKIRKQIEKEFGPDQDTFLKHIYEQEKKSKARLVSRLPRKLFTRNAT